MFPDSTTLTPVRSARVVNRPASVGVSNLKRTGWVIGTYDPAKVGINVNTPKQYLSAEAVGEELGYGFPCHKEAEAFFKQGTGIAFYVTPQDEASGATAATGDITYVASSNSAGTISLFVAGEPVSVGVPAEATADEIALAVKNAINAERDLRVTADSLAGKVTVTAKAKGTYGNFISLKHNLGLGQELPPGVIPTVNPMSGGATDPDIQDALDGNGKGDASNGIYATDASHTYKPTADTMNKIAVYVGLGDQAIGCWAPTVGRPIRFVNVNTVAGTAGYNAMKVISDASKYDRANAFVGAPDSPMHPASLAAEIMGVGAAKNQAVPHMSLVGVVLSGYIGKDRWTSEGANRQQAIVNGISCARVVNGKLTIDGMVTMYRPSSIPVNNNAYRSYRNISIAQNILNNHREVWAARPSFTIVSDVALVDPKEKPYVLDKSAVEDINMGMLVGWEKAALIFESASAIEGQEVNLREANNGFDVKIPVVYSAEGVVSATTIYVDISLAVYSK